MDFKYDDTYWQRVTHAYGGKPASMAMYLKMLEIFCESGEIAGRGVAWPEDEPWREYEDPLLQYLTHLMSDPQIQHQVLSNRMCAKVFFTNVGRFIVDCIHHQAFLSQTCHAETTHMKQVADMSTKLPDERRSWQKLVSEINEKHQTDGFDGEYFLKMFGEGRQPGQSGVKKLIDDWGKAISENLRLKEQKYIQGQGKTQQVNLKKLIQNVENTLNEEKVPVEQAVQAWNMMDGNWSETEFERHLNVVKLQDRYPQLHEVVMKMGRAADNGGRDRLTVSDGTAMKISHSAGSDIEGITIGNNLSSLLPIELATYADEQMEDVFYYRYTRHRLQTFDYRSKMSKPSRRLSFRTARRLGPMIVCVDTSASMYGPPQRIIQSLLSLLEETAERLHRDCYLIDFSVAVKAIDLKLRMKQQQYASLGLKHDEVTFDKGHIPFIGGGTSARGMMNATFDMLDNGGSGYMNADVLWISDFLMPLAQPAMLARMKSYRLTGTRFYGLCIRPKGDNQNRWAPYFDQIYAVEYRIVRRY